MTNSATLWIVAHPAPLSMGFSRQENWSGLLCPCPGDLPTQGSNPHLLWLLHCKQVCYRVQAHIAHGKISQWIQDEVLRPGRDFIRELADQEDGRLAPQNNHHVKAWLPWSFMDQRWGRWRNKAKRLFDPCSCPLEWQGNVVVSLPYSPSQVGGSSNLPEAGHYFCLQ